MADVHWRVIRLECAAIKYVEVRTPELLNSVTPEILVPIFVRSASFRSRKPPQKFRTSGVKELECSSSSTRSCL